MPDSTTRHLQAPATFAFILHLSRFCRSCQDLILVPAAYIRDLLLADANSQVLNFLLFSPLSKREIIIRLSLTEQIAFFVDLLSVSVRLCLHNPRSSNWSSLYLIKHDIPSATRKYWTMQSKFSWTHQNAFSVGALHLLKAEEVMRCY